jgi:1,4-dihydroxy-2-naphthoyl-CoA hydrolase
MTDHDPAQRPPLGFLTAADLPPGGAWLQALGLVFDEISGTRVTAHLDLGPQHHTPWGVVHGGVYTTAIESVASVGASATVFEHGQFAVGVNNSTDFLRSMREGRVDIVAEPVIQGRVQQLWQVIVSRHDDGKAIAQGRVRLQNVPLAQPQ